MKRKPSQKIEERAERPQTLGAARQLIDDCFAFNGWNERERAVYLASLGLADHHSLESVRAILGDLERSKMLLFKT